MHYHLRPLNLAVVLLTGFIAVCAGVSNAQARKENLRFPADAGIVDVTRPPYTARGDGKTDDTATLQKALDEHTGSGSILYFPNGVYLVSGSLRLPLKNLQGNTNYGNTHLLGESRTGVILRLKDGTFPDPARPAAVIDSGPHGSADWFHNSVENLTIETGKGNPGAIGLRFFSNNTGVVRDVSLRSGDGQGIIGLDLAYNDMNGPLLVQRVAVYGFVVGVKTGATVNSQTFSQLSLEGQTQFGFRNEGQFLAIEDFTSVNAVPALSNASGLIALAGARLTGVGGADQQTAIRNTADMYMRDVHTTGYHAVIESRRSPPSPLPAHNVVEFTSDPVVRLFSSPARALCLPIQQAPKVLWDDPAKWVSPLAYGARPNQEQDAAPAIQAAIDSGAATVYLPTGNWRVGHTIHVRGRVRRIIGVECNLEPVAPLTSQNAPIWRVEEGVGCVQIERMSTNFADGPFFFLEQACGRTLILRDVAVNFQGRPDTYRNTRTGAVFLENVVGGPFHFQHQQVWARQLNQESQGTHIHNDGATLWILGLKTERGGTLIDTFHGGRTEVLGGLCYTTTAGKLAPMFVNSNSAVSVTLGERCYSGDPYTTILRETRGTKTKTLSAMDPAYRGRLVLYAGYGPFVPGTNAAH